MGDGITSIDLEFRPEAQGQDGAVLGREDFTREQVSETSHSRSSWLPSGLLLHWIAHNGFTLVCREVLCPWVHRQRLPEVSLGDGLKSHGGSPHALNLVIS